MIRHTPPTRHRAGRLISALAVTALSLSYVGTGSARADSFVPISGAGSTWSQNALQQWISAVSQYGERVNYAGTGSSDGRAQFIHGTVDFAASDIPFQAHPADGSPPEVVPATSYAYIPVTAGGTVFMYNLTIAGHRVTNIRMSDANIVKIYTGVIKKWNDPALLADNPQLALPDKTIVPVVRSDGSGSTAQFTSWMIATQPSLWNTYCSLSGRAPACGLTSQYPTIPGMIAQAGDLGVSGYVSQSYADGAIGYVNYSYALQSGFPVVKMLNAAGYYTEPTPDNVAVSLLAAQVDTADKNDPALYLTQKLGDVYTDPDPRTYPLSSYSYMIVPTTVQGQFTAAKGKTLAAFGYYAMCQGQQSSAALGYSPMPVNLVQDTFDQITKIPGAVVQNISINSCNNPTLGPNGTNLLATQDPMPPACDKQGPVQCSAGTGGAINIVTPVSANRGNVAGGSGGTGSSGTGTSGGGTGNGAVTSNSTRGSSGGTASATSPASRSGGTVTGSTNLGGTSASGGGLAATGSTAGVATSGNASGAASCDPSTGTCASASGSDPSAGASGGTSQLASAPQTIAARKGWTGTQSLMLLAGLLVLAVVVAPGLTSRIARRPR